MKKTLLITTAAALFILSLTGCAGTVEPVQTEDRPPQATVESVPESTEAVESAQVILSAGNTQLAEDNADTEDTGSQEKLAAPAEPSSTLSTPTRFCSFLANRKCRKMAGKGVQPLNNYTCCFRPSSLKQADKSGLDGLQASK